ncbi:hypothetical protein K432DRAFT_429309 [Lepidopterella palustris CBS 459.81]|uniref:Uncharacterized protein n=1 Tax=Lepidopterella palustris CBS 459.81 TaxID=1314670 RepID=A0A8E2E1D0_9PEZI|nr:hypothetical protein K432DRAFT_429309 [Lepidopterella palustris CBS 459.81]
MDQVKTHTSVHPHNSDEFRKLLEAVLQANENLVTQNRALQDLLKRVVSSPETTLATSSVAANLHESTPSKPAPVMQEKSTNGQQTNADAWESIFGMSAVDSEDFMQAFYHWIRPSTVEQLLNSNSTWTSWSYTAAFPELSGFLKRVSPEHRCHCQVDIDDLFSLHDKRHSVSYSESKNRINLLWDSIKDRPAFPPSNTATNGDERVSARLFKIVDLSPLVLTALLGSTPQSDLSYMAAFVERHLKLSNWGKVSLLKYGDMDWSSYTFEYHFSFYYVTPEYSETESIKFDPRKCRRSAPFGREMATKTRYIHEETLSFLLVGHFKDVTTCVQLAESYFKFDPYAKKALGHPFRQYDLSQSPGLMLLSWISVGLHHVLWRWQSAIEAVEHEIKSSSQIIFMTDRSDLMADDPQFSLSKTYFWALQAYKLFEETLLDTIGTWNRFKTESLPRLRDRRVDQEEWQTSIQDIDDAIAELEVKVNRIRKRQKEVKDLRTGLISASALFDSRTTVRQGENIRLLTYITILFFPLSFGTSIFGMQIVGNSSKAVTAFAISLPAITLGTAFLVFNMQNLLDTFSAFSDQCTRWLRQSMRYHRRQDWKERAIALHEDEAMTRAPVRKARRQSSGWVYVFFMLEHLFVAVPVAEILAALRYVGFSRERADTRSGGSLHRRRSTVTMERGGDDDDDTTESEAALKRRRNAMIRERIYQSLEEQNRKAQEERDNERGPLVATFIRTRRSMVFKLRIALRTGLGVIRALSIPIWIVLLAVEYIFLIAFLAFRPRAATTASPNARIPAIATPQQNLTRESIWAQACAILGLDALIPPTPNTPPDLNHEDIQAVSRAATRFNTFTSSPRTQSSGTKSPMNSSSEFYSDGFRHGRLAPGTLTVPTSPGVRMIDLRRGRGGSDKGKFEVEAEEEEGGEELSSFH